MREGGAPARGAWAASGVVVGLYVAVALALILSGSRAGRGAWDSEQYHEPAIRAFAEQLPSPDLSDYASATTPGYHLALAVFARLVSDSTMALQLAGSVFTVALFGLVSWWVARRAGAVYGVALCLPLIASNYALFPGVWLLPDNLAWLGVIAIVLLAIARAPSVGVLVGMGAILLGLVLVRQIHLWAACVVWASAWMGAPGAGGGVMHDLVKRARWAMVGVLVTVPAFAAVAWFVRLWGGLSPPTFQDKVQGANPATPAFMLMELAILGIPLLAFAWAGVRRIDGRVWALAITAAAIGVALAAIPETTWSTDAGRYSGWWNMVRKAPTLGGRTSSMVLVLAPLGAVVLTLWLAATPTRSRLVVMATLAGFVAAQTASHNAWQRYHEPLLLILLAVMGASIVAEERRLDVAGRAPGRVGVALRLLGAGALTLMLSGLTARGLIFGSEVEPAGSPDDTAVLSSPHGPADSGEGGGSGEPGG